MKIFSEVAIKRLVLAFANTVGPTCILFHFTIRKLLELPHPHNTSTSLFFSLRKVFLFLSLRHRFLAVQLFPMLLPECGQPQQQRLLETSFTCFSQKIGEPLTGLIRGSGLFQSCQSSNGNFFIDLKNNNNSYLSFDHAT